MAAGNQWKHMESVYFGSLNTFILSVKLETIRIDTSLNILPLVAQNSKTLGESIFSCT